MKRRQVIKALGVGAVAAGMGGCGDERAAGGAEVRNWSMVTTWPKNFPGLGTGANYLAELIGRLSGGRLRIKVYGAEERVGALEVFDSVARGEVEMGHGAAYYWRDKSRAAPFFAAVPFGLTALEMNAWLYHGGGLRLWREIYHPFGLVPFAVGNTGAQMGGWFNREINSLDDLKGLRMRIPGLGGEVLRRAGGEPVLLPGGEVFPALKSGTIDAAEWIGPYNDLAFGLHKAARYYYTPGWQEPATTLECIINQAAYEALPADLQLIIDTACRVANQDMLADFTARNNAALRQLVEEQGVALRHFPDPVLRTLRQLAEQVIQDEARSDPDAQRVYASFSRFRAQARDWHALAELAYLEARQL